MDSNTFDAVRFHVAVCGLAYLAGGLRAAIYTLTILMIAAMIAEIIINYRKLRDKNAKAAQAAKRPARSSV